MFRFTALTFCFLAAYARAEDAGAPVTFNGTSASPLIQVQADAKPGDVLWDSGPSDPGQEPFDFIIFQGVLSDPGVSFEASIKNVKGWSGWAAAEIERSPNGRFWGKFLISGMPGSILKVRVVHRGIAPGQTVEIYEMEAAPLEIEGHGTSLLIPSSPAAPFSKPAVIPNKDWGAVAPTQPYIPMVPDRITVHHTQAAQPMTLEDAVQEMKFIQRFHQKGRGWIDIGYHFLIDGSGRIFQGRPEGAVGAHVKNKNTGNVGISLMGSFQKPQNQQPTAKQMQSLIALTRWVSAAYAVGAQTIKGHRDQRDTDCPGANLYSRMDEIRRATAQPRIADIPSLPLSIHASFDSKN